jgi:hypothetical protein
MFTFLSLVHVFGLVLGVGAATVKLVLLFKCKSNSDFVSIFLKVVKPVTMIIIIGQVLLTLSGIGWLIVGYSFSTLIIIKIILLGSLWVVGPLIDNLFSPKFQKSAPAPGESVSVSFVKSQKQLLAMEILATGLFYVLLVLGVLL